MLGKFRLFPALPKFVVKPTAQKRIRTGALRKQPFKRESRLSAVPTDQAERIVARPHHVYYFKGELARPSILYRQALESNFEPLRESAIHQGNRVGAVATVKTQTESLPVTSTQIIEHLPGDSTAETCQKQHARRNQA